MLAAARRILRNEEEARDVVQKSFLAVHQSLPSFRGESRLGSWIHRITINNALMSLRSRRRRPEESIEELLPEFLADGHASRPSSEWALSPEKAMARAETRALVRKCIDRLPENYRAIVLLRDVEEMDSEEAARLLGVSVNVAKVRLHRARQALRSLLDPHFPKGARIEAPERTRSRSVPSRRTS
jgi:RNA polymerase sigma-70 factor, ECF subfamily